MGILTRVTGLLRRETAFNAVADRYDVLAGKITPELYRGFVEAVTRELKSGRILDVGTGPGYVPIEIAKRNKEVCVDGVDIAENFITIAERNAREAALSDRLHFEPGDATGMRFEDNSYDMVISTGALHHWKNPAGVIDEMYRVLRPGGQAWVLDPNKECSKEEWKEFLEKITKLSEAGFFGRLWLRFGMWREIRMSCYSMAQIEEMAGASSFGGCDIHTDGVFMTIKLKKGWT